MTSILHLHIRMFPFWMVGEFLASLHRCFCRCAPPINPRGTAAATRELSTYTSFRWQYLQSAIPDAKQSDRCEVYLMEVLISIFLMIRDVEGKKKKKKPWHSWWECRLVQPLWKTVWRCLKKLKMGLAYVAQQIERGL